MRKRIPIADLLHDPLISSVLENEIDLGRITVSDSLPARLINTLRMLKRHLDEGNPLPGYTETQAMARNAGISDNLSKTTIKQAFDLLNNEKESHKLSGYVDVVHHALATRLYPRLSSPLNQLTINDLMANVVVPAIMLKQQFEKVPESADVAPMIAKMARCQIAAAELLVSLLEDPDASFTSNHLQAAIIQNTGHTLSYSVIKRVEKTVEWVRGNFEVEANACNHLAQLVMSYKDTVGIIAPDFSESYTEAVCEALQALIETYIKNSSPLQSQLYNSFAD